MNCCILIKLYEAINVNFGTPAIQHHLVLDQLSL